MTTVTALGGSNTDAAATMWHLGLSFRSTLSLSFSADTATPICCIKTSSVTVGYFRNEPQNEEKDAAQGDTVNMCHRFYHSMQIGFVASDPGLSSKFAWGDSFGL